MDPSDGEHHRGGLRRRRDVDRGRVHPARVDGAVALHVPVDRRGVAHPGRRVRRRRPRHGVPGRPRRRHQLCARRPGHRQRPRPRGPLHHPALESGGDHCAGDRAVDLDAARGGLGLLPPRHPPRRPHLRPVRERVPGEPRGGRAVPRKASLCGPSEQFFLLAGWPSINRPGRSRRSATPRSSARGPTLRPASFRTRCATAASTRSAARSASAFRRTAASGSRRCS